MRRRRVVSIALCVLIGAAINVGVAWWCVGSAQWRAKWSPPTIDQDGKFEWLWKPPKEWAAPDTRWCSRTRGGCSVEVSRQNAVEYGEDKVMIIAEELQRSLRAGWPLLALETRESYPPTVEWNPRHFTARVFVNSWNQGLHIAGTVQYGQVILPLRPRWGGFIGNTAMYGTLVWSTGAAFLQTRRWRRRRGGRCVRCGYQLAGATTCAECGEAE